jgi:hypothetical protein
MAGKMADLCRFVIAPHFRNPPTTPRARKAARTNVEGSTTVGRSSEFDPGDVYGSRSVFAPNIAG